MEKEDAMTSLGFVSVGDFMCEWTVSDNVGCACLCVCVSKNEGMRALLHAAIA